MYRNLKCVAIIPARKNSKGLKNKNLRLLDGKSLVEWSILHAIESKVFDLIVVSSDSRKILSLAKRHNVVSSGIRPDYLSSDETLTIDVVRYEAELLNFYEYDCLVLLQPTSPLRSKVDILESINLHIESNYSSVLSVTETKEKIHLIRSINEEGKLMKITSDNSNIRRQDAFKHYYINGAIYINSVKQIKDKNFGFNDNLVPYIMPYDRSIDIDGMRDLITARNIIRNRKANLKG